MPVNPPKSSDGAISRSWPRMRVTVGGFISAVPDFAFAASFLITWFAPFTFGPKAIENMQLVMMMEFITIHSTAIMFTTMFATRKASTRIVALLGLGLFYSLFAGGFALAFHAWWPIVGFWMLTGKRMVAVALNRVPNGEERQQVTRGWQVSSLFYILCVMLTCILPIPEFGITREVVRSLGSTASGLWIEHPQTVIACGFLYFTALGLSGMVDHSWVGKYDNKTR